MIEQNYLSAGRTRRTQQLFEKWAEKSNENVVAGPGFEPGHHLSTTFQIL
jgi:hypothetical protein